MENKSLKPKIRFKGFTEAWEQRKFKDYGSVAMCKRIFKYETSDSGDIPFYKIGTFGNKADAFITNEKYEYYKSKFSFPNNGDILLSASGTIGRIVEYSGEKAYFQDSNIVWLNHNDNIKNSFLKVLYPIVKWDGIEGSTIKRLYNSNFLSTEIHVPKVKEQEKIGVLFEKIDNLITLHQRKCDKLIDIKKSLLEKMFPKNGNNIPEIRFKGFTEAWEQRKLLDVANYKNGKAHENDIDENGKYIVINSKFVSTDGEVKKYSNKQNEPLNKNDIAFVLSDVPNGKAISKTFLVDKSSKYTLNQRIAGITPHEDINPKYLAITMNRNKYFLQFDDGVKQTNLSLDDMQKFENYYPTKEEQDKIGRFFEKIDNLITLHQKKLNKLKNIKKSLLEKMFV